MAFTILSLLFFRTWTTFALDTFACDRTNSMSLTSAPVFNLLLFHSPLVQLETVFSWMFETASPRTLNFLAAASCACGINFWSWLPPANYVGIWSWALADIWFCEDKEDILIFLHREPSNPCNLSKAHGHSLPYLLFTPARFCFTEWFFIDFSCCCQLALLCGCLCGILFLQF